MNPYRDPSKPTNSRLKQFFVDRVTRPTVIVAAFLLAGIALAATPSLRVNGIKFPDGTNTVHVYDVTAPEFGADRTGVVDATTTIQSAITTAAAASTGGIVYIPAGTFKITTTLNLASSVRITGAGKANTTLSGATLSGNPSYFFTGTSLSDLAVTDLSMTGPGTGVNIWDIYVVSCTRCTFSRLSITNSGVGIYVSDGSVDSQVSDNDITNMGQQGIVAQGGRNNKYLRNRIDTIGTTNQHHGIYVESSSGNSTGHLFADNSISNIYGTGVHVFESTAAQTITNEWIRDNRIFNTGLAAAGTRAGILVEVNGAGSSISDIHIDHNSLSSCGGSAAIIINNSSDIWVTNNEVSSPAGDGILVDTDTTFTSTRVHVAQNVISSVTGGNGINVLNSGAGMNSISVANNVLDTVSGIGIWFRGIIRSSIVGNTVKDYDSANINSNAGIRLESTSTDNIVASNLVQTVVRSSTPAAIQIVAAADSNNVVSGNNTLNNSSGLSNSGTATNSLTFTSSGAESLGGALTTGGSIQSGFNVLTASGGNFIANSGGGLDSSAAVNLPVGAGTASGVTIGKNGGAATIAGLLQTAPPMKVNATIASATTIAPTLPVTHISGTTTIQTMTAPTPFAQTNGGGCLTLVFDGVAPWNAAGNIFVAGTPTTAGTSVMFCYDNATSKWYPSRTL